MIFLDDRHSESVSQTSSNETNAVIKVKGRSGRVEPASSSLLRRAGLGPDVRRAFDDDSADKTEAKIDPGNVEVEFHLLASHPATGDVRQREELDSGLGPSGGGSQKFNRFDWVSDTFRVGSIQNHDCILIH